MRTSHSHSCEEDGYLNPFPYVVVLLVWGELNCSVKQRTVVQAESRGDKIIPYIYYIYEFILSAKAQPTEAERRLPQAILGKLSEL